MPLKIIQSFILLINLILKTESISLAILFDCNIQTFAISFYIKKTSKIEFQPSLL